MCALNCLLNKNQPTCPFQECELLAILLGHTVDCWGQMCVLLEGGSEQFSALCCFLVIFGQMQTHPHFLRTQGRTEGSLGVSEEIVVLKHNALEKVVEAWVKYLRYRDTWASDSRVLVKNVFNLI